MMKAHIMLALFVSLILVGGAGWIRLNNSSETEAGTLITESNLNEYVASIETASLEGLNTNKENLTQTDLIGRQLFSEYVDISTRGQATSANLDGLASTYADNILNSQTASRIGVPDILVVPDSTDALRIYSAQVFSIRAKYESIMTTLYKQSGFSSAADPKFKKFMLAVGDNYKKASSEMKVVPAPSSLADNHVALINNYLSSSAAATSLSNVGVDPVIAFASLNIQAKNTQEEAQILSRINIAMLQNGLTPGDI